MINLNEININTLTGLRNDELASVLINNPRAYMAVKGAVAERHLEKQIIYLLDRNIIKEYRSSCGDFDKDFYVTLRTGKEISLECKNVEVGKITTKQSKIDYICYLLNNELISCDLVINVIKESEELKYFGSLFPANARSEEGIRFILKNHKATLADSIFKKLPQELRESGISRYYYSRSGMKYYSLVGVDKFQFIDQFKNCPLSIDFQRTRNSTDGDGDNRKGRLYLDGEIDIVGACLFSRTLEWEFVYGVASRFEKHAIYSDRYRNKVEINTRDWFTSLSEAINAL